jgi:hypothetical protein
MSIFGFRLVLIKIKNNNNKIKVDIQDVPLLNIEHYARCSDSDVSWLSSDLPGGSPNSNLGCDRLVLGRIRFVIRHPTADTI